MNTDANGSTAPVGVVLAGGESRRMGRDKAVLTVGGETLPALAARRLARVCADVAVADGGRGLLPGLSSLSDGPGRGPAAGILGAAASYPGRPLLVLACDLPRVPAELLAELARQEGIDWAVPRWGGRVEPLCALYGPATLAALAARVERGLLGPHGLAEEDLVVRYLEGEELARFGDPAEVFLNLNTPADLERYESRASGGSPHRPQGQISRRSS
jgi:molybdenum cofactor guanylyltransferase